MPGGWRGWARLLADGLASAYDVSFCNVAISGVEVHLTPGDPNGLFQRFSYTDATGQSVLNADIQNFSVYAETVIVGGRLWLPQTNVTIYAKKLIFVD